MMTKERKEEIIGTVWQDSWPEYGSDEHIFQKALGTFPKKQCPTCGRMRDVDDLIRSNSGFGCMTCLLHSVRECDGKCIFHQVKYEHVRNKMLNG